MFPDKKLNCFTFSSPWMQGLNRSFSGVAIKTASAVWGGSKKWL